MSVKTIFFDLDGTLLPMDEERFTRFYFNELAKEVKDYGFELVPLSLSIWKGVKAMVANNGTMTNYERFWISFFEDHPDKLVQKAEIIRAINGFYANGFAKAKEVTGENPLAAETVRLLKEQGYGLVLATNPIFPYTATLTRMSFVGLKEEDFLDISAYENSSHAKPNHAYYADMLERNGLKAEEVFMIGNDYDEDIVPARKLGISGLLVSDCLLGEPDENTKLLSFAELYQYVKEGRTEELFHE